MTPIDARYEDPREQYVEAIQILESVGFPNIGTIKLDKGEEGLKRVAPLFELIQKIATTENWYGTLSLFFESPCKGQEWSRKRPLGLISDGKDVVVHRYQENSRVLDILIPSEGITCTVNTSQSGQSFDVPALLESLSIREYSTSLSTHGTIDYSFWVISPEKSPVEQ